MQLSSRLFADLLGHPIGQWKPTPRLLTAAAFLGVSIVAGVPVYRDAVAQRKVETAPAAAAATPLTDAPSTTAPLMTETHPVVVATALPPAPTITTPVSVAPDRTEPAKAPSPPARAAVTDDAGQSIPELLAIAQRRLPSEVVTARVHETVEQDPALADLYTVRLTLTAAITHGDTIGSAFTLQSRGGGFQIDSARAQARQRLVESFHARVIDGQ